MTDQKEVVARNFKLIVLGLTILLFVIAIVWLVTLIFTPVPQQPTTSTDPTPCVQPKPTPSLPAELPNTSTAR